MKTLLLAALLLAPAARAQVATVAPPAGCAITVEDGRWVYREPGAAPRALADDERRRVADFFKKAGLVASDARLSAPLYARTALTGQDPVALGWVVGEDDARRLTPLGRAEIPASILIAYTGPLPPDESSSVEPPEGADAVARAAALEASLPAAVAGAGFDGARPAEGSADLVPAVSASGPLTADMARLPESLRPLPDAPAPRVVPAPDPHAKRDSVEDKVFWSTWWGYHAAWAADFATTAMILHRGGYETDPLYTRFGNRSMLGVIGSAAVVHAGASIAGIVLHDEAKKYEGWKHWALEGAAILINGYGIGVHSSAAAGNVGVLQDWNRR